MVSPPRGDDGSAPARFRSLPFISLVLVPSPPLSCARKSQINPLCLVEGQKTAKTPQDMQQEAEEKELEGQKGEIYSADQSSCSNHLEHV